MAAKVGHLHEHSCPFCGRVNTMADNGHDSIPQDGDLSMCWKCGEFGVFNADGTVRKPTPSETAEIEEDPAVQAARHARAESYTPREAVGLIVGGN